MDNPILCRTDERILGTRIHELVLGRESVHLISDLHLRPEQSDKLAALDRFMERLPDDSVLVVLGDLFDFWVGYKQARVPGWSEVVARFACLHERGIRSFYMWGNRDYQLDARFERVVHGQVVRGGLRIHRDGGSALLCLHGDELCQNDGSYQAAKRRLRSRPIRFLGHHLPIAIGLKVAGKARTKSRAVISATVAEDLQPSRRALGVVAAAGTTNLLFGHIHVAGSGPLDETQGEGRYQVLPAFETDDACSAVLTLEGTLELYRDGQPLPWPGPINCSP